MPYQEQTTTEYGTRVGRSFKSIGTGILLFVGATALLWWNEGRAVKTDQMLNDAEKACVVMENPDKIDHALDGELVCATAVATTTDSLVDSKYGIGATAIGLQRNVEYYQWVQNSESKKEDKMGGKEETITTYTYQKKWVKKPVDSSQFKDPNYQNKNTVLTNVESESQWAQNVTFGAYKLNEHLIKSISSREPMELAINEEMLEEMNKAVAGYKAVYAQYVHQSGNTLYYGRSSGSPEIGDVRVTFEKIVPAKVTIVSQVSGDTFKAFKAKNGQRFETLVMGQKDSDEIFEGQHSSNSFTLWLFRFLGIGMVIAGLKGIFNFLETLLKVIPFLANIVGWGIGVICTVVGIAWSLIVIALAWLFYRPVLGITLLVIAAFLVWVFAFRGKEKIKQMMAQRANATPAQ